ncbi:alpha-amylase family glycosyl hydrolase [Roseisalinus antarcticus]|uniref:Oligo-1,6-glucosidase n=1 Tax=Roseisalinus antarcticus TaxID=254357 RepID=A0A1Y5TFY3_9RHOB|nr:alpha-amylase family glycosyl hydrolase [Roseisalinus antarcticus]SLN61004.1 Oligo-1,6-glucosidase [Roseisalinus antarcticus]
MTLEQEQVRAAASDAAWWKAGVVYQVYPRSFQDSNADGIGDLAGIEARLDYLVALGVDAIWISPIFPSPMVDFGYDITDYRDIDPMFGTLADFDRLVRAAHGKGLRILLDFVPSHTSDQHPWFIQSRASRRNPKRDWYIWRDAKPDGSPPNNWISEFGGPSWTWDAATGQYYHNTFLSEQPALNWENPEVRAAMLDVIRFWYGRGVDGLRVDAITHIAPEVDAGDNPPNPDWTPDMGPTHSLLQVHSKNTPGCYEIVRLMRQVSDAFPGRVLIGETNGALEDVMRYYGPDLDLFQLPFNFGLVGAPWSADGIAGLVETYEAALPEGAWPNWVLGNHDVARIASRVGAAQARVAAALLLTLRGTPTLYQGDELGMESAEIPPEAVQDPWEKQVPGLGLGRDPVRTPMPWSGAPNAGFSAASPWLPVFLPPEGDVATQEGAPGTMLTFVRSLIALRRAEVALTDGSYRMLTATDDVLVFERRAGGDRLVVCLNFSGEDRPAGVGGTVRLSSVPGREGTVVTDLRLGPDEAVILRPA